MNLYTDDNPETTIKGLGFKNKNKALETIKTVEKYFDIMIKNQVIPSFTPHNVRPKQYINNKKEAEEYYKKQKMYRILGMLNRAKGMINRVKNKKGIMEAISVFEIWMDNYSKHNSKHNRK